MADTEDTTERWLPFAERPDAYEVSDHGRVRSRSRVVMGSDGKRHPQKACILTPSVIRGGYLRCQLWIDRRCAARLVHRLVFTTFVGAIPAELEINHIDGVKTNNRVENLELVTTKGNAAHAVRLGLMPFGGRKWNVKLTNEQALEIVRRRAAGERSMDLAAEFGVARCTIAHLVGGRNWAHVTGLTSRR